MIEQVFWQAERECKAKEPPADAPLPEAVDVVVIGAGVTGLAAARNLAKGGASVAVLERHPVGWGASGRNGGHDQRRQQATDEFLGQGVRPRLRATSSGIVRRGDLRRRADQTREDRLRLERCGLLCAAWKPEHFGALAANERYMAEEADYTLVPPIASTTSSARAGIMAAWSKTMPAASIPSSTPAVWPAAQKAGATVQRTPR